MTRALYAAVTSLAICLVIGPALIAFLRRLKFGQSIRLDGPQSHLKKSGTPTMGGIMILLAVLGVVVLFVRDFSDVAWVLVIMFGYGLLGFLDDIIIIISKRSLGLRAREKLFGQVVLAAIVAFYVYSRPELGTRVMIPYTREWMDLGAWYVLLAIVALVGSANAVNFTDGLDGLAAGTVAISAGTFMFIAFRSGNHELSIIAAAILGACIGFSWFNSYPAQVIMGDTGSLALGGGLACIALLLKRELILPIVGGVFVMEMLSVVIQVVIFKLTGKRVFRMSPIHHHFELKGWMETKIVTRFWILALLFGILGVLGA